MGQKGAAAKGNRREAPRERKSPGGGLGATPPPRSTRHSRTGAISTKKTTPSPLPGWPGSVFSFRSRYWAVWCWVRFHVGFARWFRFGLVTYRCGVVWCWGRFRVVLARRFRLGLVTPCCAVDCCWVRFRVGLARWFRCGLLALVGLVWCRGLKSPLGINWARKKGYSGFYQKNHFSREQLTP